MTLLPPLVGFDAISLEETNGCLVAWQHRMGPLQRPDFGRGRYYGLRHHGLLVGVAASDQMIAEATCGIRRDDAIELTRVCASRPDLCRVIVRLWREFVFPPLAAAWGCSWAISYQDNRLHNGDLYRFDGWLRLGKTRSGTDARGAGGTRHGRNKTVWGWHQEAAIRAERRAA